jgi:lipopolysaccharide/colanic/teichoic acid biosynthesis glycosyltransferase
VAGGKGSGVPIWERVLALVFLMILSPLLLVLILWVKSVSPGPGLFHSDRIGRGGNIFCLFKLRTMIPEAPQFVSDDLRTIATENDSRLIPGGRILRKGFDELFQMINVLKGEMRFIGPRPDLAWMKEIYLPTVLPRVSIPPGITGLAQILGSRDLTTREGYLLDLWYVSHRTTWLDLLVFIWTPIFVLFKLPLPRGMRNRFLKEMNSVGQLFRGEAGEESST